MKANVKSPVQKFLILLSDCWCLYMYRLNHADLNFNSIFIKYLILINIKYLFGRSLRYL